MERVEKKLIPKMVTAGMNIPHSVRGRHGYVSCDRYVRIKTSVMGNESVDDKSINTVTLQDLPWGEMVFRNCYKRDDDGCFIPCKNSFEAELDAELSVWDYVPKDRSSGHVKECEIIRCSVTPMGDIQEDGHYVHVIAAPNLSRKEYGSIPLLGGVSWGNHKMVFQARGSITIGGYEDRGIGLFIRYPKSAKQDYLFGLSILRPIGTL